jgi:cupin 2 domain-containing protein
VGNLRRGNLFAGLVSGARDEKFDLLAQSPAVRIERIVSTGQASPSGFWYDQPEDEFVVLLSGAARLRFEQAEQVLDLKPGDWVDIPAQRRHRVDATQGDPPTVWLVVYRKPA